MSVMIEPTTVAVPPPDRARRHRRRIARADLLVVLLWATAALSVALYFAEGRPPLGSVAAVITTLGIVTGLIGTDLVLVMLVLAARIPLIDRTIGHDRAIVVHRQMGKPAFYLLLAHGALLTIGYAASAQTDVVTETVGLFGSPDMPLAYLSIGLFAAVIVTSLVAVKRPLPARVLVRRPPAQLRRRAHMIPREGTGGDGRDSSLSRLVAVTLLPFLGLYSAFGLVDQQAGRLTERAVLPQRRPVRRAVGPERRPRPRRAAPVVDGRRCSLGLYLLRRLVDHLHERTGVGARSGILTAVVESFFILVVIFGGFVLLRRPEELAGGPRSSPPGSTRPGGPSSTPSPRCTCGCPSCCTASPRFLADPVWPMFWTVVSQPIIWLAVAALVYGSQVLSLADLWRRGKPAAARVVGASRFDRRGDKRALRPGDPARRRPGRATRCARRSSATSTTSTCRRSTRSGWSCGAGARVPRGVRARLHGGDRRRRTRSSSSTCRSSAATTSTSGTAPDPLLDLVDDLPWEPLRLCLLAVAFRRCLELFQQRTAPRGRGARGRPDASEARRRGGGRWSREPRARRLGGRGPGDPARHASPRSPTGSATRAATTSWSGRRSSRRPRTTSGQVRVSDVRVGDRGPRGRDALPDAGPVRRRATSPCGPPAATTSTVGEQPAAGRGRRDLPARASAGDASRPTRASRPHATSSSRSTPRGSTT